MTREFGLVQDFYLHLHDMQSPLQYPYDLHGSVAGTPAGYEMTTGAVVGAVASAGPEMRTGPAMNPELYPPAPHALHASHAPLASNAPHALLASHSPHALHASHAPHVPHATHAPHAPHAPHATHVPQASHAQHAPQTTQDQHVPQASHAPHAQHAQHAPHAPHAPHATHAPRAPQVPHAPRAPQVPHSFPIDQRKRKVAHYTEDYEMSGCEVTHSTSSAAPTQLQPASAIRKRKPSSYSQTTIYEDDATDDARSTRTVPDKRQNHSEIEKRRRDKMNTYISELSTMVPMCGAMARKLDKLTVLRMAVQHLRSVRGAMSAGPLTACPLPGFLSERELNDLVLRAAHDCFLMVVGCDRGRLLYISASVRSLLYYTQSELLGQSLFDMLHPKDVSKVKEQLSSSDFGPRHRLIDVKTMLPVKEDVAQGASRLCPGARRSFTCRIKCSTSPDRKPAEEERKPRNNSGDRKYCVVQCTGYLKIWETMEVSEPGGSSERGAEDEASNLACLVTIARVVPELFFPQQSYPSSPIPSTSTHEIPQPHFRELQFTSRHTPDGKFIFVDQRVTMALGFLPQELLGSSVYEYVSPGELGIVARAHKTALLSGAPVRSEIYCFRRRDGLYANLITHFKPFRNPWTKDVESLVANNTVLAVGAQPAVDGSYDNQGYKNSARYAMSSRSEGEEVDVEIQRLIDSQLECHKMGSTIAEEALLQSSNDFSPEMPADVLQDNVFNHETLLVDNMVYGDIGEVSQTEREVVRNNVPLSAAGPRESPVELSAMPQQQSPEPSDGNGEAAMSVIMSLLEADAGLGGPVNLSGLPWPLP